MCNKNAKNIKGGYKITQKSAFTLVEMSVVIVIIAIMLSTIIVSRMLVTSAKVNAVYREILDFNNLTTLFTNEFQCAPGDCPIALLSPKIIDKTPSGCFNLSTTTGMGNAASLGNSVATTTTSTTQYIAAFGTGIIDSNAKRTCAFYQMQAFEPSGFGWSTTAKKHDFNSILGVQNANAIGVGKLDLSMSNINVKNASAPPSVANISEYNAANPSTPITIDNYVEIYNTQSNTNNCTPIPKSQNGTFTPIVNISTTDTLGCQVKNGNQFFNQDYMNTGVVATLTSPRNNIGIPYFSDSGATWSCKLNGQEIPWNAQCAWSALRYSDTSTPPQSQTNICANNSVSSLSYSEGFNRCFYNYGLGNPKCNVAVTTINNLPQDCLNALTVDTANFFSASQIKDYMADPLYNTPFASYNKATATYNALRSLVAQPTISSTIQTATNPLIKPLQKQAMWDIRTVGSGVATGFYPFEAKNIPAVQNKLLFIARDLSTNYIGAELTGANTASVTADIPAFSSAFALKLDQKYDDGKPYSGNIIAGQNISNNTAANGKGCTTMTASFSAMTATDLTANYNKTTNLANGCVVAAVING